uniref:Ig-like domain-containing protein n=1 Tax=Erpetoichthys calabaricus TaxID=27687 RepID=A0A8C4TAA7_ERPCA
PLITNENHKVFFLLLLFLSWTLAMIQALTGSCLVIPCTFTSPQRHSYLVGIWRMNHYWFGVDVFKESQSLENWSGLKVAIIGDLQLRNCTTQLDRIRLENQGVYYFKIEEYYYSPPFKYSFTEGVHINVKGSPVKEGESTSLTCSAPLFCPKQPPSLAWSDTLNGTVHQTVHTGIKESRSVSSRLTFTASFHLHMKNITFPPNNTTASLNYTSGIKDGDPVALICSSSANPAANYSWFQITEAAILLVGSEQSLTFTTVTPSDSGRYYCQAQNSLGLENSTFVFLNVLGKYSPKDTSIETSDKILMGSSLTLTCNANANPAATYTWFEVSDTAVSMVGSGQSLTIKAVTPSDSGRYCCMAQNQYGAENSSAAIVDVLCTYNSIWCALD